MSDALDNFKSSLFFSFLFITGVDTVLRLELSS